MIRCADKKQRQDMVTVNGDVNGEVKSGWRNFDVRSRQEMATSNDDEKCKPEMEWRNDDQIWRWKTTIGNGNQKLVRQNGIKKWCQEMATENGDWKHCCDVEMRMEAKHGSGSIDKWIWANKKWRIMAPKEQVLRNRGKYNATMKGRLMNGWKSGQKE